jgi:hypothetical protein
MVVELGDSALSAASAVGFLRVEFGLSQRGVSERSHDVMCGHAGVGEFNRYRTKFWTARFYG